MTGFGRVRADFERFDLEVVLLDEACNAVPALHQLFVDSATTTPTRSKGRCSLTAIGPAPLRHSMRLSVILSNPRELVGAPVEGSLSCPAQDDLRRASDSGGVIKCDCGRSSQDGRGEEGDGGCCFQEHGMYLSVQDRLKEVAAAKRAASFQSVISIISLLSTHSAGRTVRCSSRLADSSCSLRSSYCYVLSR